MSAIDYKIQTALASVPGEKLVDVLLPGLSRNSEVSAAYAGFRAAHSVQDRHVQAMQAQEDFRAGKLSMSYPEAGAPLWSVLAAESVAAWDETQLPLQDLAFEVHPEVMPGRPGQQAKVSIYVDYAGHTTVKDASTYGAGNTGSGGLVEVTTHSFTTESEVSEVELRNFGSLKRRLGGMINDHRAALAAELGAAVKEKIAAISPIPDSGKIAATRDVVGGLRLVNGTAKGLDALNHLTIPDQVYPLFPGGVPLLLLSPEAYGKLLARTRDDFGPVDGSWGIGKFRRMYPFPGMETCATRAFGMALKPDALCWAAVQPFVDEGMGLTHWEPLGTFDGVPLWLNVWYDNTKRLYKFSVNSQVGFRVANPQGLYVLWDKNIV